MFQSSKKAEIIKGGQGKFERKERQKGTAIKGKLSMTTNQKKYAIQHRYPQEYK